MAVSEKMKNRFAGIGSKLKVIFHEREPKHMMNIWQAAIAQFIFSFILYFLIELFSRRSITAKTIKRVCVIHSDSSL